MSDAQKSTDPIRWMQETVRDWLNRDSYFGTHTIVLADRGDVMEASQALVGKTGLAIIVEPTQADISYSGSNIVLSFDEQNPCTIVVWESVLTNRSSAGTGRRASEVAMRIIKQFRPGQTPAAPCTFTKAALASDSNGQCIYTLTGKGKIAV